VSDPKLKKRVIQEGLLNHLRDNVLAWQMDADGRYLRRRSRAAPFEGQTELLSLLSGAR
jgi:polyphosphate kinase